MLKTPLPAVNDPEGSRVPDSVPFVVDAHVHLFPDGLFAAIWKWFDEFGWPIRYKLTAPEVVEFLLARGVKRIVGLHYAHKPGVARHLNAYMAGMCKRYPQVTGTATVFPGEEGAADILREGFAAGLSALKLHAHVQCFHLNGRAMEELYEVCVEWDRPAVMHVGREPKSPAYPCDPYELCGADKVERVLKNHPRLKLCVPHLGIDEYEAYRRMLERYDTLWLDTSMALAGYLPDGGPPPLATWRPDRILYGTDFPHIPFAWDRELGRVCSMGLDEEALVRILGANAMDLFGV